MICNGFDGVIICKENEELNFGECKIKVFAQKDVIHDFFNGIDDDVLNTIARDIESYNYESLNFLLDFIKNKINISTPELNKIEEEIRNIKENHTSLNSFQRKMNEMKIEKMNTIVQEIEIMPKYDLIQMSQILIEITRLKRIITSERVTVDGKVLHFVLSLKEGTEKVY